MGRTIPEKTTDNRTAYLLAILVFLVFILIIIEVQPYIPQHQIVCSEEYRIEELRLNSLNWIEKYDDVNIISYICDNQENIKYSDFPTSISITGRRNTFFELGNKDIPATCYLRILEEVCR